MLDDWVLIPCRKGWERFFKWYNIGPFNIIYIEELITYTGCSQMMKNQKVWQVMMVAMLYVIWDARNKKGL